MIFRRIYQDFDAIELKMIKLFLNSTYYIEKKKL